MARRASILATMHPLSKRFKGADLSGQDLTDWVFLGADLSGANLSGCKGVGVDLRCATLDGANLSGANLDKWNLTGADVRDANLTGVQIKRAVLIGTDLTGSVLQGVHWDTNGTRTRGIILPDFDPAGMAWANDCHDTVAKLILREYPADFEMRQLVEFILSRMFPCWSGFVARVMGHYPHRVDDLERAFSKYPAWKVLERWRLALAVHACRTHKDFEALRLSPHYEDFKGHVEWLIRQSRSEQAASGEGAG